MSETTRKNINRGHMRLTVWQDASAYYGLTCRMFRAFPYELKRVACQQVACVDSIHRNIAEGYCRRTLNKHLQFLNISLSSAGESVSGLHVYRDAGQIPADDFDSADALAYKIENGLKLLIESLEAKRENGGWEDSFIVRESNAAYIEKPAAATRPHHSTIPTFQPHPSPSPVVDQE